MSAEERREAVVAATVREFAHGGLDGTSTETIARRAGISQPYLFRLFPTKLDLFLATVGVCFDRVEASFQAASGELEGEAALSAMGMSYATLIGDPDLLLLQLHTYAASGNAEVRGYVRGRFEQLIGFVERRTQRRPPRRARVLRDRDALERGGGARAAGLRRAVGEGRLPAAGRPVRRASDRCRRRRGTGRRLNVGGPRAYVRVPQI